MRTITKRIGLAVALLGLVVGTTERTKAEPAITFSNDLGNGLTANTTTLADY